MNENGSEIGGNDTKGDEGNPTNRIIEFKHPNQPLAENNPEMAARLSRETAWGNFFVDGIDRINAGEGRDKVIAEWTESTVNIEDKAVTTGHHLDATQDELRTDERTGLGNELAFLDELARMKEGGLLYLDLNKFKLINDAYGHETGDKAIELMGVALRAAIRDASKDQLVRDTDLAFRLHGDEHAVLLAGVKDPQVLKLVADRVQEAISQVYVEVKGKKIYLSASVGGVLIDPKKGIMGNVKDADTAMYFSKKVFQGKKTCVLGVDEKDSNVMREKIALQQTQSGLQKQSLEELVS